MTKYLTIGEVAKLKGTTAKALRIYDRMGLIKPCYVDSTTNYRYYSIDQLFIIELILAFKNLGVPLKTIKEIILSKSSTRLAEFCVIQRRSAQEQVDFLNDSIVRFDMLEVGIYHDINLLKEKDIYWQDIDERTVIMRPCLTDPNHEDTLKIYFDVYNEIRNKKVPTIYATGSLVSIDPSTDSLKYTNMFIEVSIKYNSDMQFQKLPRGRYICVNYRNHNKYLQIRKLRKALNQLSITPLLTIEADTFVYIIDYSDPLMEIQVLVE